MDCLTRQMVSDRIEATVQKKREEDKDYSDLRKTVAELSEKVAGIYKSIDNSDVELLERYTALLHEVWGFERVYIYTQGFKDSAQLMKWIQS